MKKTRKRKATIAAVAACAWVAACAPTRPQVLTRPAEVPPTVDEATARLEKALGASNITVADVATFVAQYGWELTPGSAMRTWHWRPSTGELDYYVATIRVAFADTTMPIYFKTHPAGAYNVEVEAIRVNEDGTFLRSPRSPLGWSDGSGRNALPGVAPAGGN